MFLDRDLYAILGVSRTASAAEVTQAYHKRAREFHPDSRQGTPNIPKFMEAKGAYNILGDDDRRAVYDATLPPLKESDSSSQTETETDSRGGTGEQTSGDTGDTDKQSGEGTATDTKGSMTGAFGNPTAPYPASESKINREKEKERNGRFFGPEHFRRQQELFELQKRRLTRGLPPSDRFTELRKFHPQPNIVEMPRPSFRRPRQKLFAPAA